MNASHRGETLGPDCLWEEARSFETPRAFRAVELAFSGLNTVYPPGVAAATRMQEGPPGGWNVDFSKLGRSMIAGQLVFSVTNRDPCRNICRKTKGGL